MTESDKWIVWKCLVFPGVDETLTFFSPRRAFIVLDFPTLGYPTRPTLCFVGAFPKQSLKSASHHHWRMFWRRDRKPTRQRRSHLEKKIFQFRYRQYSSSRIHAELIVLLDRKIILGTWRFIFSVVIWVWESLILPGIILLYKSLDFREIFSIWFTGSFYSRGCLEYLSSRLLYCSWTCSWEKGMTNVSGIKVVCPEPPRN